MIDGKILMELIPHSDSREILQNIEGMEIVELSSDRDNAPRKLALLTSPKSIARQLLNEVNPFLIGHSPSAGSKELEIRLFYRGKAVARTSPKDTQPRFWYKVKNRQLRALYSDWDCINQIFGRI